MVYIARKNPLILLFTLFFALLLFLSLFVSHARGTGILQFAKDVISSDVPLDDNVEHSISFQVPYDSYLISANHYITIELPHFTNITEPRIFEGYYSGTPIYTVNNSTRVVQITGVNILPGAWIRILGISTSNPPAENLFQVNVIISEDPQGQIITNMVHFDAVLSDYQTKVSASIAPPVAAITISGFSAPGTFITIMENGTVLGTNVSSINGLFVKYLNGLDPGSHSFSLYGVDQSHRSTSFYNLEVNTPIYQETTVSNILLSPTIQISDYQINLSLSETLTANGSTIPLGNVTVFTESPLRTYYATANAQGIWSANVNDINQYLPGDYRIYALVNNSTGVQSIFSHSLQFTVLSSIVPPAENPGCSIARGDLNCDGIVNLADFSVLMYYWGTNSPYANINPTIDSVVNLTDLSIMMFYWGK